MSQLSLEGFPLSQDEKDALHVMMVWHSIKPSDLMYQLRWPSPKFCQVFDSLIDRGLIEGPGHVGEWWVKEEACKSLSL